MRVRRTTRTDGPAGGEDSFLDIVANLVGILVILVMVIGVRTKDAAVESAAKKSQDALREPPQVAASLMAKRDRAMAQHNSLDQNVREIHQKQQELEALVDIRQRERHQLQLLLTAARMELDERRETLDESAQLQVALAAEERELAAKIEQIEAQRKSIEAEGSQPIELEHLPTPMARTVFGNEEHFRLKGKRITYVPLQELTDLLKAHAPTQIHRLNDVAEFSEILGPVQGFNLTYTMHRHTIETNTQVGPVARQVAELKQFVLLPLSEDLGEPLDAALQANSQFLQYVETFRPGATVVTVWTYPDSFDEYRRLKKWLYERGFSSAARPLPDDQPISGSPRGTRSAAQ